MRSKRILLDLLTRNWLILAIILLAAFLRWFYYMGVIRGDDFSYAFYAHEFFQGGPEGSRHLAGLNRPGLYVPAAILFRLFGESEFVATLFPLIASIATLFFIYKIAFLLSGRKAALVGAFLWAVFPLDIFMATQLDPEAPLAMAGSGAIYSLLLAGRSAKLTDKLIWYFVSGAFLLWSFLIKLSSAPIVFVVVGILVMQHWPRILQFLAFIRKLPRRLLVAGAVVILFAVLTTSAFILSRQPWPVVINNLELTAYDIAPGWVIGRTNPIQQTDLGGNWAKIHRKVFPPPAQPETLTTATAGGRLRVFDVYVAVFLVAAGYALVQQNRSAYIPMIWLGILFFYMEWGPFPRSFGSSSVLVYTPLTHWIAADNFLWISVPMVLVIAIYLAQGLDEKKIAAPMVAGVSSVIVAALLLDSLQTHQLALNYLYVTLIFTLALSLISPFALFGKKDIGASRPILFAFLIPLIGLSSLIPSPPYHAGDFFKEQDRRDNLRAASSYLLEHPDLPIRPVGYGLPLDVYSEFQFGFTYAKGGYLFPETRFTRDRELVRLLGVYFLKQGCGQLITHFREWPFEVFGDPDSPECISLIRKLPKEKKLLALIEAKRNALAFLTKDKLTSYLAASANAKKLSEFVNALSLVVTYFPEDTPISQASGIIQTYGLSAVGNIRMDLISLFQQEQGRGWAFGAELTPRTMEEDEAAVLVVDIGQKTEEAQPIIVNLNLKANTAYILEVELRAFAQYDLLRFPDYEIPDSYLDSWNRDLDWTTHNVVFVTPDWPEDQRDVKIELARINDRGGIAFRVLNLVEVNAGESVEVGGQVLNVFAY